MSSELSKIIKTDKIFITAKNYRYESVIRNALMHLDCYILREKLLPLTSLHSLSNVAIFSNFSQLPNSKYKHPLMNIKYEHMLRIP